MIRSSAYPWGRPHFPFPKTPLAFAQEHMLILFDHNYDSWSRVSKLHELAIGAIGSLFATFFFEYKACATEGTVLELPKINIFFLTISRSGGTNSFLRSSVSGMHTLYMEKCQLRRVYVRLCTKSALRLPDRC